MKWNWGWGIVVAAVLFMSFILTLVYKCNLQTVDLVSEKYYEQEIKYQSQVDKKLNTADLTEQLKIEYDANIHSVAIKYPSNLDAAALSGDIVFYKPDDSNLDFSVKVRAGKQLSQVISSLDLPRGWWRLKINWNCSGTSYYQEEKILIN